MKLSSILASAIVSLAAIGCRSSHHVNFMYDGSSIVFKHGQRTHEVAADEFQFVADWSSDYSRSTNGTGAVFQNKFLFRGALNHSRDIYFVYDLTSGKLHVVPNASAVRMTQNGRWAAVIDSPLYADGDGTLEILMDHPTNRVATIRKAQFQQLRWSGDKLILKLR